jgi:hypothetical protein
MTGGLIINDLTIVFFFNEEKLPLSLNDDGDGKVRECGGLAGKTC